MKKSLLLLIILFIGINSFSQKKEKFKPGVKLEENIIISEIDSSASIIFIFKGHTHLISFYLDLANNLKAQFNTTDREINFNYDLFAENVLESDLNKIPTEKINPTDFEIICLIEQRNIKGWDNHKLKKRKQKYYLDLELKKSNDNKMIESARINVNSYYMTLTQNKNSSKLIYHLINE